MGSVTNRCLFMAEQHRSSGAPTRRAILHAGSNVQQWLARLSSPPILNASPEAAAGGGLALLKTGDRVRIDLNRHTADRLISADELEQRRRMSGDFPGPGAPDTFAEALPQQVGQHATGACLELATRSVDIFAPHGNPRHSHQGGLGDQNRLPW